MATQMHKSYDILTTLGRSLEWFSEISVYDWTKASSHTEMRWECRIRGVKVSLRAALVDPATLSSRNLAAVEEQPTQITSLLQFSRQGIVRRVKEEPLPSEGVLLTRNR